MMDPALKTALALCVLVAGSFSALLFRHHQSTPTVPDAQIEEEVLLRFRAEGAARARRASQPDPGSQSTAETLPGPRPTTVVAPLYRHEPPPSLASDYPETRRPPSSRWGTSMEMMLPRTSSADEPPNSHVVVDGDTLPALAERYLGSAARAREIYQLNRDQLPNPELLPIGLELKLPPRGGETVPAAAPASNLTPTGPLVPVR
jgi:nucleoid-associated protein YgaU